MDETTKTQSVTVTAKNILEIAVFAYCAVTAVKGLSELSADLGRWLFKDNRKK